MTVTEAVAVEAAPAAPPRRAPAGPLLVLERTRVALAVCTLALLVTAGAVGLFEPTETRYAEVAREMRAGGDWLIPRLGGLPHFHKPPLAYWATALGIAALGENSWGARIPVALATALSLVGIALAMRRHFASLGVSPGVTVWLMASAVLPFGLGRALSTDPYLAATTAWFWALAPSPWALVMLGVGFVAKGHVVLLCTAAPVLMAAAWGRDRRTLRLLGPPAGWLLAAAIALPWYVIVAARTPGLLGYLLGNQVWQRYATEVHERGGPVWYFVATLLIGMLPWTALMIAGVGRAWRERAGEASRLLLSWLVLPLVLLSFSGSKLSAYYFPAFPAAAALAAVGWRHAGRAARIATVVLFAAIAGYVAFGVPADLAQVAHVPKSALELPGLSTVVACVVVAAWFTWRRRAGAASVMTLSAWIALVVTLAPFESFVGGPRAITRVLAENRHAGEPVVVYEHYNAGIEFYLGQTVRLWEAPREDQFATAAERARVFATGDSIVGWAGTYGRVWLLARADRAPVLADSLGLAWTRVANWRRQALGFVETRGR